MRTDDPKSYTSGEYTGMSISGDIWNYGIEIWCNLEGLFVTLVADLSHLSGQNYEMSICSLGLMGTEYVRSTEVPQLIKLKKLEHQVITIENIHAVQLIGNILAIHLRQKPVASLSWVTIL